MTDLELKTLMDSTGLYYDPEHPDYIEEQKLAELPLAFMEWDLEEVSFFADGECYFTRRRLLVRVFWDSQTKSAVRIVTAALKAARLGFTTEKEFLPELGFWQTTFTTEV